MIYRFQGRSDGAAFPSGQIVFDQVGNTYGVTQGGDDGGSTVYELTPSSSGWSESSIYPFSGKSRGGLAIDQSGNLYGTSYYGGNGAGVVFQLVPSASGWTANTLHVFTGGDGSNPLGDLVLDNSGDIYGETITSSGGQPIVYMLYRSGDNWKYRLVYHLPHPPPGRDHNAQGLTVDAAGNLYGASCEGGSYGHGYVFELQPEGGGWIFSYLHDFQGTDGDCPITTVLIGTNGAVYGTAAGGGAYSQGVVWQLSP